MTHFDVIVIGVGGMGSSTVYHLARRGVKVLGLERFDIPHDQGSSHGVNRIIRLAYWEDPCYVPLLRRAYQLWRELEHACGEQILYITGGIDAGPEQGPVVAGSLRSCQQHSLPYELLDAGELNRRFPGYRLPGDMCAVYQPDGGFVRSERAIVGYASLALDLGAEIHGREPVLGWEPTENGVKVRTSRTAYTADRLVITAGPWAGQLVPELLRVAVPERQVLIWTQPLRPAYFRLNAFPVFNMEGPEGAFYGFPVFGIPGFKLGKYHHLRQHTSPSGVDREIYPEDEQILREAIERYFPDAGGPTLSMKTCLFTNSPDEHFILDRHPDLPQVVLAAGFSGHGFKFCSVVGELMAELALDGASRLNISPFGLARFAG